MEAIKESTHNHLADDLEINKAVLYLQQKDVAQATETLKSFEKRATKMASNAAVNLSTIFYLVYSSTYFLILFYEMITFVYIFIARRRRWS